MHPGRPSPELPDADSTDERDRVRALVRYPDVLCIGIFPLEMPEITRNRGMSRKAA